MNLANPRLQPALSSTASGRRALLSFGLLALLAAASLRGQETVLAIEFSFSNPGARSLGFGGAFAALADDATAAFANPAGLEQLARPEVSIEARRWDYSTGYRSGGRLSGEPTGAGIDTTAGFRTDVSSQQLSGISFLSFVYPQDRWSAAFYRHQLAKFEFFGETQGFLRSVDGGLERFPDQRSDVDFDIVGYGLAFSYRITERLSVGAGVTFFDGRLLSAPELYRATSFFDPSPFLPEDLQLTTVLAFEGTDWDTSAGFLWKVTNQWRLGGFYRGGPDFDLEVAVFSGPAGPAPDGTRIGGGSSGVSLPDVWGLGLSYRAVGGNLTVGFEWDRVEYATIVDSLDSTAIDVNSVIDDGNEWHLGGEYLFLERSPIIAVRCGVWLDPDHRLRATPDSDLLVRALRPPGEDDIHYAAGIGVAFPRFQIDFGFDLSEAVDTLALSVIHSF